MRIIPPPPIIGSDSAFTLIELAVALVIIGLIVGGVLVGRDLIKASEARSVITDIERLNSAVRTFQGKYGCLPGDCTNATTFFPNAVNGDGNGLIGGFPGINYTEVWQLFYQLGAAYLIPGAYTGVAGPVTGREAVPGSNVMASRVNGAGYTVVNWNNYTDGNCFSPSPEATFLGNAILFGKTDQGAFETYAASITPQQAQGIDSKTDDGLPGSGKVMAALPNYPVNANCTTTGVPSTAQYKTSYSGPTCALIFFNQF